MKTMTAKSCKQLFIKCILFATVFNALIYLATVYARDHNAVFIAAGVTQVCVSFFAGLYIRKINRELLSLNNKQRKRFAKITFVGLIVISLMLLYTDLVSSVYINLRYHLRKLFGLDRILTLIDFLSILVCLGAVFFGKPAQRTPLHLHWERPSKCIIGTSCKNLFVKCIILIAALNVLLSGVLNLYFYLASPSRWDVLGIFFYAGVAQICLSLFLGLYIRHKNQNMLSQEKEERKHYVMIALAGLALLLIVFLFPGIVPQAYHNFKSVVYEIFGLVYFLTIFDLSGILICLGTVFLYKPVKKAAYS